MSWGSVLLDLYEKNAWRAGKAEQWNNGTLVLLPVGYDTMKAQIEITVKKEGEFYSAHTLSDSESETIVPRPEARTSGVKPLPLCDSLSYIAGDFCKRVQLVNETDPKKRAKMQSDIEKSFEMYIKGLKAWHEFDANKQIEAVYKYVLKKSVIADLQQEGVLMPDKDGVLSDKIKINKTALNKVFVRFRVYDKNFSTEETAVWLNKAVQSSFLKYYLSTKSNKDLCLLSGNIEISAKTNPTKIRGEWDTKASLISSNDDQNYTYRGRFKTKDKDSGYNEAFSVGYETSQKVLNALKWIIRRQGYVRKGVCIVTWESDLKTLPQFFGSPPEIMNSVTMQDENGILFDEDSDDEEEISETGYMTAKDLNSAINGYSKKLEDTSRMYIISLDSITPGRLALTYFKELSSSRYLDSIRSWQSSCCWRQEYFGKDKKLHRYDGIASISEIAYAVYGTEQNKRITLPSNKDGKTPMLDVAFSRLIPCIIDGAAIPRDIVKMAVAKASNPFAYENSFNYLRVLHIACSLVKKFYWEREVKFDMKLDEKCTDRSYLYGRLLAVAEKIERSTFEKKETRITNAERYMSQFSRTPWRTWEIIRKRTSIYLNRLTPGSREYYKNLYGSISILFEEGAFELKSALDGKYLLGYDCQREALKRKNKDENNTGSAIEENNDIYEEETK